MSQPGSLESLASLLECPICLESFTDPRMLTDCFHTLCYKCLSDHIDHFGQGGQFECPVCRASVEVPDDGVGFFPKNFFMNSFLAALTKARVGLESAAPGEQHKVRNENDLCSNWEDGSDCAEPKNFCITCCEHYCKNCSRAHQKSKSSRHHKLVAVDDLSDEILRQATLKTEVPNCLRHNKKLKLYCSTCKCAVCSTCCAISHQFHNLREMADVDNELKGELRSALTALKQLIEDANNQIDHTNKQEVTHDQNTASSKEAAKCLIQKMHRMIDLKGQEIDQKLSQMNAEARSRTDAQNKQTTLFVGQLESLQSFVFDLIDKGTVFNRLASMPEVDRHLDKLKNFSPEVSTVVPTKSELLGNTVDSLVLEEEVPLDEENKSLKIRQKCCVTPDKVDIDVQTEEPNTYRTAVEKVFSHVRYQGCSTVCLAFVVVAALVAPLMVTWSAPCGVGTFVNGSACTPCPVNTYSDQLNIAACTNCPDRTRTSRAGCTSRADCRVLCDSGKELVDGKCKLCEVGYYKNGTNAAKCSKCPEQQTTSGKGTTDLSGCSTQCGLGTFIDDSTCTPCPVNTYSDQINSSACKMCPDLTRTLGAGCTRKADCKSRPLLNRENTVIKLSTHHNEATIDWSVSNLDSCTLVLVIVCEMDTNNCVDNLLRDVSKSSLVSVPQGSAYWFSFHFYYGSGHLSMYGNAMFISSKLTVQQYGWSSNAVQRAVRSLGESLHCDVPPIAYGRLQDVPRHHPQVDVINCVKGDIDSVIEAYNLNKQTAEKRHLVLFHWTLERGDIKDTLRRLGDNQVLFKRVIRHDANDDQSASAAAASHANYFLEVTGQNMNK